MRDGAAAVAATLESSTDALARADAWLGAFGGPFAAHTLTQVTAGEVEAVQLDGVGHYAALEAPAPLADAMLDFLARVDGA